MSSLRKYVIIYNTLGLTIILCTYTAVYNTVKLIFRTTCIKKYFSNPTPLNHIRLHYVYFIQMCYALQCIRRGTNDFGIYTIFCFVFFFFLFDCSPTHRVIMAVISVTLQYNNISA